MKTIVLALACLLPAARSFAQRSPDIDSFRRQWQSAKSDTDRVKAFVPLCNAYYRTRPDSFFLYCRQGVELARRLDRKKELTSLLLVMAQMLTDTGNYDLARRYAEQGIGLAAGLRSKPLLIDAYIAMGQVYDYQSDFVRSGDYFFKALAVAQEIGDHGETAMIGTNLCADFFNEGDLKKAAEYAQLTIREAQLAGEPGHLIKGLYFSGAIRLNQGDTAAARDLYRQALAVCAQHKSFPRDEAEIMSDLADLQPVDEKIALLQRVRKMFDSLGRSSFDSRVNWRNLGTAWLDKYKLDVGHREELRADDLKNAEENLRLFLEKSAAANDRASVAEALQYLTRVYEYRGDYRKAFETSKQYHAIRDSIYSQENKNRIAALESRHEIEKKNQEIDAQKDQVREQKRNTLLLLAALALAGVAGFLFFRLSALRQRKNRELVQLNAELGEANRVKARFFGILSHDLRSPVANLVNFLALRKIRPDALSAAQVEAREQKIGASAQTLLETMEGILLWSKGQMKNFRPENSPVRVDDLFAYVGKIFDGQEGIAFSFSNPHQIVLETDADYLQTILRNLTANAVKALAGRTDGQIGWQARREQGCVVLSIADNGPGIEAEKIQALHDESVVSGTRQGMGLHIIRDLAKAIGCRVALQPEFPGQTRFTLTFDEPRRT